MDEASIVFSFCNSSWCCLFFMLAAANFMRRSSTSRCDSNCSLSRASFSFRLSTSCSASELSPAAAFPCAYSSTSFTLSSRDLIFSSFSLHFSHSSPKWRPVGLMGDSPPYEFIPMGDSIPWPFIFENLARRVSRSLLFFFGGVALAAACFTSSIWVLRSPICWVIACSASSTCDWLVSAYSARTLSRGARVASSFLATYSRRRCKNMSSSRRRIVRSMSDDRLSCSCISRR
mmetsp:Transcript_34728/g.56076  ORF Transcript_34728/g.56076 Transcript_34728/m.56076 type:complete len:232 (-) Transcript_34728:607-1302(-)